MFSSTFFCPYCGAENNSQATNCRVCRRTLYSTYTKRVVATQLLLKQRYRIVNLVGQGGMGAVYRAEDIGLGNRPVAVKEMSLRKLNRQEEIEAVRGFKREALMLAGLQHSHLPRIYDHFPENGQWYLVMDFIEGETLEYYLQQMPGRRIPLEEALDYGIQLCTVLDYLHTRQPPIIFRDLKPTNIMRTNDGQLYLIDFGIARHFKPGQAKDTTAFGSPGYASPEQYGQIQTTPRSDIYNLGVILHQMLTGRDPAQNPFFFTSLPPEMEATGLPALLTNMLAMQMQHRPSSALVVKQALQQIVTRLPGKQNSSLPKMLPTPRRIQTTSSLGTLISTYAEHHNLVSKVVWSPDGQQIASASYDGTVQIWHAFLIKPVITYRQKRCKILGPARIHSIAWSPYEQDIAIASDKRIVQIWNITQRKTLFTHHEYSDSVCSVAWSPDGQKLVSASRSKMYVWKPGKGKISSSSSSFRGEIQDVAWSPNSKYIAIANKAQIAYVLELSTQMEFSLRTSYGSHKGAVQSIAWAPDGIRIASASDDRTVQIWNALTGNHLLTYSAQETPIQVICWSPDGTQIASAGYDGTIQIWNALTGNHLFTFQKHSGPVFTLAWSPDGKHIASGGADKVVHIWQDT